MSARSFTPLVRATRAAFRSASQQSAQRNFTSSAVHNSKFVPSFPKTSSPELDQVLAECREKIFIIGNLPPRLQKTITTYQNKQSLEAEPITVEIAGEEFKVSYLDPKSRPSAHRKLLQVLDLCSKTNNWDVLLPFLQGLHAAKAPLRKSQIEQLIRKVAGAGQIGIIIEAARKVEKTGIALDSVDRAADLMFFIQFEVFKENWSFDATNTALKRAEQVAELLESKHHAGGKVTTPSQDPRISPMITGTLLQLATIQAIKDRKGEDARGLVEKYAQRLTGTVVGTKLSDLFPEYATLPSIERTHFMRRISPTVQGIRLAQTVLPANSKTAAKLAAADADLSAVVNEIQKGIEGPSFGKHCFDVYTGSKWDTYQEFELAKKE